ncbi:MAG: hypothetical protein ABMA14_06555 [Hyphomonadaceae bacterium]
MAVSDAQGAGHDGNRFKAAGPTAAAIGIITSIIGVSLLASSPENPATPVGSIPPAISANPAPTSAPEPDLIPGLPGIQQNQPGGAGGAVMGMEIVVKFKDDAKVKDIIDAFWKDQGSAKTKFNAWKANRPEFAKLKLDRVTYSNELVLVHDGSAPAAEQLAAMKAIASKLGSVADVSYAEPNLTAHPGGQ